jgi:hypothetical protein
VEAASPDVPAPFFGVNDRDYEVEVSATSIDPIPAGDFFTVELDTCVGASGAGDARRVRLRRPAGVGRPGQLITWPSHLLGRRSLSPRSRPYPART